MCVLILQNSYLQRNVAKNKSIIGKSHWNNNHMLTLHRLIQVETTSGGSLGHMWPHSSPRVEKQILRMSPAVISPFFFC